jgi:hypothetical protein
MLSWEATMTLLACPKPEGVLMTETDVNRDASGEAQEQLAGGPVRSG